MKTSYGASFDLRRHCLQKALKTEYYLWQIFSIENDSEKIQALLEQDKSTLDELLRTSEEIELQIREKRKEQAVFAKDASLAAKAITKKESELHRKVHLQSYSLLHLVVASVELGW